MESDRLPGALFTPAEHKAWEILEQEAAERLARRREEFRISKLRYQPADDLVLVFRLQAKEQKTESGIVIPDHGLWEKGDGKGREAQHTVLNEGVLVKAGLGARDWMRSHGIFIGDIVRWGRFAGDEEGSHRFQAGASAVVNGSDLNDWLQVPARECHGSFDLDDRLEEKRVRIVYAVDAQGNGLHMFKPVTGESNV